MGGSSRPVARTGDPMALARVRHRPRVDVIGTIAGGGALGALARYGLALALPSARAGFPWATLAANLSGCLVLGFLMVLVLEVWPPTRYARPFAAVGFLGSYTTFSTFAVETDMLGAHGHPATAAAYVVGSLLGGLVAAWVGMVSARGLVRARQERGR